jgi:hypothetical protein
MPTIELNLSPDYIKHWGFIEAIREFFQNAIDGQTACPDNTMFWNYDRDREILEVGNTLSSIPRHTLMIGSTTKAGKKDEIGKYGEGYKLALLVLTRDGFKCRIKNYGQKELWTPVFIQSRKLGCKVLAINIRKYLIKTVPDRNLVFEVAGITPELFHELEFNNLFTWPYRGEQITAPNGEILLHPDYKGRVYVSNLFVYQNMDLTHGYNFKPSAIQLDRERRLVSDFDLHWATSTLWANAAPHGAVINMISTNARDTRFILATGFRTQETVAILAHTRFIEQYGEVGYPVSNQEDADRISRLGLAPVIVNDQYRDLILSSGKIPDPVSTAQKLSPYTQLAIFAQDHKGEMDLLTRRDLAKLLNASKFWVLRSGPGGSGGL